MAAVGRNSKHGWNAAYSAALVDALVNFPNDPTAQHRAAERAADRMLRMRDRGENCTSIGASREAKVACVSIADSAEFPIDVNTASGEFMAKGVFFQPRAFASQPAFREAYSKGFVRYVG